MKSIAMATVTGAFVLGVGLPAYSQSTVGSGQQLLVVPPMHAPKTGSGDEWKIVGEQSGGRLAIMEIRYTAPRDYREPHVHTREEEGWYVIEGELEFEAGDRTAVATPGTFVWAPRDIPHRYRVTKAPARYLLIFSPAGIEGLFREVEEIRSLGVGTREHMEELERRRAKYGVRAGELPKKKKP